MVSLYKRATLSQRRILRVVEGAVKNAAHGHPDWVVTDSMARSIAKRAAGTLASQLDAVLAAVQEPSGRAAGSTGLSRNPRLAQLRVPDGRGTSQSIRRSPLSSLQNKIASMADAARAMERIERYDACVEILGLIKELRKQ